MRKSPSPTKGDFKFLGDPLKLKEQLFQKWELNSSGQDRIIFVQGANEVEVKE
jgi:hypothetical protein